jgi:hypothetical protein
MLKNLLTFLLGSLLMMAVVLAVAFALNRSGGYTVPPDCKEDDEDEEG